MGGYDPESGRNTEKYSPPKDGNQVVIGKAMILCNYLYLFSCLAVGRDSSVGIANRYGLDGPEIESRRGERFSAPFQTGPGPHQTSYTTDTGSFPELKREGVVNHPHLSQAEVKERVKLYLYSP
jgi:hypothetical protein